MAGLDCIIKLTRTGFCVETAGFSTKPPRLIPLLVLLLALHGCAQAPTIYTMQPSALETIRAEISTIGVYLSPERPQTEVLLPAKGIWGGLKRGIVVGASLPVMIGFVSPIPGGTVLGLFVSPFAALIGGVYGIFTAIPAEEVEHAEVILAIATEKIRQRGLSDRFIENIIDRGNARTQLNFVALPPAHAPSLANPSHPPMESIDARLQIQVQKTGLHGMYSIDPPTDTFVQVHVQLVRLRDNTILLDEHFTCASDEERTFRDWADQAGADLIDEFQDCVPELAEKIVDDFFRVYPLKWSDGVAF
jgi:hypothetical protein